MRCKCTLGAGYSSTAHSYTASAWYTNQESDQSEAKANEADSKAYLSWNWLNLAPHIVRLASGSMHSLKIDLVVSILAIRDLGLEQT